MSIFSDAFNRKPKTQIGSMDDSRDFIEVDASINENHTRQLLVTDNKVEDGSSITDHAAKKPETITMQLEISDIPLSTFPSITGVAQGAALAAVRQRVQGLGGAFISDGVGFLSNAVLKDRPNRLVNNLSQVERYIDEKKLLFLISGLKRYENMMITNVSIPRSADIGDTLVLNITLKEVRIVSSQTVQLPEIKTKNVPSAASEQNSGKQKLSDPKPAENERGSSSLFKLGKFTGVL